MFQITCKMSTLDQILCSEYLKNIYMSDLNPTEMFYFNRKYSAYLFQNNSKRIFEKYLHVRSKCGSSRFSSWYMLLQNGQIFTDFKNLTCRR